MKEKLMLMFKTQRQYNELVLEKYNYNSDKYTVKNTKTALFDKLGELNHLLKSEWCWYKEPGYYDKATRDELLIAYIDCICFILTMSIQILDLKTIRTDVKNLCLDIEDVYMKGSYFIGEPFVDYVVSCMDPVMSSSDLVNIFAKLLFLGYKLGFSFDDIYKAYNERIEYYTYDLNLESEE